MLSLPTIKLQVCAFDLIAELTMSCTEADQRMLEDDANPIVESLKWRDPYQGTFWLKKLPQGLMRVSKSRNNSLAPEPVATCV